MTSIERMRPVERRVVRWAETGMGDREIGHRFGRGERWVAQVRFLAHLDRPGAPSVRSAAGHDRLRPLERRVLRWREEGADLAELGERFRRSPAFLARVEDYAHYKLGSS